MDPTRIAHIIGKMRNGGVETVVMNYYRNIDRTKIQYDFIIDEDSSNKSFQTEIEALGGKVITVPPYQKPIAYHQALYKLFKTNKYPLVYSHINTLSVFPLFAAWRAGVPIRIAHNHSTAGKGELKRNIMKYSLRPFSRVFPTHMCACSVYAGEWLFGKHAMSSVTVWPNAVDVGRFAYNREVRREMRASLGLEGRFVVGHVGRFMHQKNHKFLFDVFMELKKIKPEALLLLAGDGQLLNVFRDRVREKNLTQDIIFTGSVNDIERYYQAMDVFVFPSHYEGLGMAAVEAQLTGLPTICSDELPEEARVCENLRFMSLKKSASEWAREALSVCEGHIRRDMSLAARKYGFDVREQAARMSEWYCELLGIK